MYRETKNILMKNIWNKKIFMKHEIDEMSNIIPGRLKYIDYFDLITFDTQLLKSFFSENNSLLYNKNNWYENQRIKKIIFMHLTYLLILNDEFDKRYCKIENFSMEFLLFWIRDILINIKEKYKYY